MAIVCIMSAETARQILIVGPDGAVGIPLRDKLMEAGFSVRCAVDRAAVTAILMEHPPHLVIVDSNVPNFMALNLILEIRSALPSHAIRFMILSPFADEDEVVTALNVGADDYLAKPYSVREVVARASGLLRSKQRRPRRSLFVCDPLVLDCAIHRVTAHGRILTLTGVEYRLLEFMMSNIGRALDRLELLAHVWPDHAHLDARTVDVNVQRLRKILAGCGCEEYVQTVRGLGYRFSASVDPREIRRLRGCRARRGTPASD